MNLKSGFRVCFILFLVVLLVFTPLGLADVDKGVEWKKVDGKEKTTIYYCLDKFTFQIYDKNGEWAGWIEEAVKEWNDANTGWKFVKVDQNDPKCQVTIEFDPELGKCWVDEETRKHVYRIPLARVIWKDRDETTKRYGKATLVIDPNITEVFCITHRQWEKDPNKPNKWGTTGKDTIDPRTVLKHELGHLLRLKHPTNMKYKTTDVMWFNAKDMMGEHPRKLSNHDIQQAKDSIKPENRGVSKKKLEVPSEEGAYFSWEDPTVQPLGVKTELIILPEWVTQQANLTLTIMYDVVPSADMVPLGFGEIFAGVEVEVEGPTPSNMTLRIYFGDLPIGPEFPVCKYVDFYPIDEESIKPFIYISNMEFSGWVELNNYYVNTTHNFVEFNISQPGIYGVSGKIILTEPPPKPPYTLTVEQRVAIAFAKDVCNQIDFTGFVNKIKVENTFMMLVENGLIDKPSWKPEAKIAETYMNQLEEFYGLNLQHYPTVEGRIWLLYMFT